MLVSFVLGIFLINLTLAISITGSTPQDNDGDDDEDECNVEQDCITSGICNAELECACKSNKCYQGYVADDDDENNKNEISGIGIIRFVDVEGGCWKIVGNDGINYEPVNLNDSYKQDGLLVKFEAELVNDSVSICMVGTSIKLTEIKKKEWKNGNMTKEQFKEFIKEKTEERKIFKFEERTGAECVDGCKCQGVVMKCELEDGTREMIVYTQSGNIIIQVKNVNASTQVILYHNNKTTYAELQNGTVKEIKIMPDEVQEKIKEKIKSKLEKFNITLDKDGIYEIQMQKRSRLFLLFPVNEKIHAQVNAENGEVVKIKNPWWGFLAKDVPENANEN